MKEFFQKISVINIAKGYFMIIRGFYNYIIIDTGNKMQAIIYLCVNLTLVKGLQCNATKISLHSKYPRSIL